MTQTNTDKTGKYINVLKSNIARYSFNGYALKIKHSKIAYVWVNHKLEKDGELKHFIYTDEMNIAPYIRVLINPDFEYGTSEKGEKIKGSDFCKYLLDMNKDINN